jgi:hypothetical protein
MCPASSMKKAVPLFSRRIAAGSGDVPTIGGVVLSGGRTGIHDCAVAGQQPSKQRQRLRRPKSSIEASRRAISRGSDAASIHHVGIGILLTSDQLAFFLYELPSSRLREFANVQHLNTVARVLALAAVGPTTLVLVISGLLSIAAAIADHLDHDDRGPVVVARLARQRCLLGGRGNVGGRGQRTDIRHRRGRNSDRGALNLNVEGVEHLQRRDVEIAGDAEAGGAGIDLAAWRELLPVSARHALGFRLESFGPRHCRYRSRWS